MSAVGPTGDVKNQERVTMQYANKQGKCYVVVYVDSAGWYRKVTESRTAGIFIRDTACFHRDSMNLGS